MPFEIVRNDIVKMQVDAIVNTADQRPQVGWGTDAGIHKAAGPELLKARERIGDIPVGDCALTMGYKLPAKYVIHAVGPVWRGGDRGEEKLLRSCYDRALGLAAEHGCQSLAFPLLCSGNKGFPKAGALRIAVAAISDFLIEHEMKVYLVVFGGEALELSERLVSSVAGFIDENYIREKTLDEYGFEDKRPPAALQAERLKRAMNLRSEQCFGQGSALRPAANMEESIHYGSAGLEELLRHTDEGFSVTLLKLIDRSGKKDSEIYKKANVDRKLFSKIRNNPAYRPGKSTAIAFALALELDLEGTKDLLARAGYALSHSSRFDIIIEYFIRERNYDVFEINEILFKFDQPLIGG